MRARFDRERAYAALMRYVQTNTAADLEAAYVAVDEVVEITLRLMFSRAGNRTIFDDLRQAARMRLYQTLPRLARLCEDSSEYYFRLCCSVAKRAMLTEYAKLRRQAANELIWTVRVSDEEEEQVEKDFPVEDTGFDAREDVLLVDQLTTVTCERVRSYLVVRFPNPSERKAAVAVLLKLFEGREISPMYLSRVYGVENSRRIHSFVDWALRATLAVQDRALYA